MRWNLLFLIFDFIVIPLPLWIDLVCHLDTQLTLMHPVDRVLPLVLALVVAAYDVAVVTVVSPCVALCLWNTVSF